MPFACVLVHINICSYIFRWWFFFHFLLHFLLIEFNLNKQITNSFDDDSADSNRMWTSMLHKSIRTYDHIRISYVTFNSSCFGILKLLHFAWVRIVRGLRGNENGKINIWRRCGRIYFSETDSQVTRTNTTHNKAVTHNIDFNSFLISWQKGNLY